MSASNVATADHPKGLAHHFESREQQKESSFLGMWFFLVQEVMFLAEGREMLPRSLPGLPLGPGWISWT